jgi:hypothetical protein
MAFDMARKVIVFMIYGGTELRKTDYSKGFEICAS